MATLHSSIVSLFSFQVRLSLLNCACLLIALICSMCAALSLISHPAFVVVVIHSGSLTRFWKPLLKQIILNPPDFSSHAPLFQLDYFHFRGNLSHSVLGEQEQGRGNDGGDADQIFLLPDVWCKEGRRAKRRATGVSSAPCSAGVTERIKQIISLLRSCFSV